jgi:hypothetical protein
MKYARHIVLIGRRTDSMIVHRLVIYVLRWRSSQLTEEFPSNSGQNRDHATLNSVDLPFLQ